MLYVTRPWSPNHDPVLNFSQNLYNVLFYKIMKCYENVSLFQAYIYIFQAQFQDKYLFFYCLMSMRPENLNGKFSVKEKSTSYIHPSQIKHPEFLKLCIICKRLIGIQHNKRNFLKNDVVDFVLLWSSSEKYVQNVKSQKVQFLAF